MIGVDLAGRTIVVTGASSGIGRETAILLAECGACVVLVGRDRTRLEASFEKLPGQGHRIESFDLTNLDEVPGWLKRITGETGPLAGLVHSAGVHAAASALALNPGKIETVLRANVASALMLAKAFRQVGCSKPGGSIVFLSSVSAVAGAAGLSLYSASKAALIGLVKSLAIEFAPTRTRVNCVVPGFVETEMTERYRATLTSAQFQAIAAMHPLGIGKPRDVANGIAFLLADTASWITGSALVIDGGYTAQ